MVAVADLFSLKSKVALITGARRGVGAATAQLYAEAGADLALCDIEVGSGELNALTQKIRQMGRRVISFKADISQKTDVDNLVNLALDELGHIDILVNSAAIGKGGPLVETQLPDWDDVINTNLRGCYLCCQAVARHMITRKTGHIINIASVEGFMAVRDHASAYSISKAGVIELTRGLARELSRNNIHVNGIAPGCLSTQMVPYLQRDPARQRLVDARALKNRTGEPEDVAAVALFLASPSSVWVHGEIVVVDGGMLA
ncbi:MAG: SDR family oxidoreductase [Dehalococcoidia bacterium]|nr:SDR family oxidoreductase [Dehalococcoidia bacterium]